MLMVVQRNGIGHNSSNVATEITETNDIDGLINAIIEKYPSEYKRGNVYAKLWWEN